MTAKPGIHEHEMRESHIFYGARRSPHVAGNLRLDQDDANVIKVWFMKSHGLCKIKETGRESREKDRQKTEGKRQTVKKNIRRSPPPALFSGRGEQGVRA
jgi:hypothetical protein